MGLSADLLALAGPLAPPEAQHGDPDFPTAKLCPRLRTTLSPRVNWADFKGFALEKPPHQRAWARLWEPGPPAAELGFALAPNSERPPRYGLQGLSGPGRRSIWRALKLLEGMRPLLSFWTITFPGPALDRLAELDTLPVFQDRVRKELMRRLADRGLTPLVVGVAELQPKRTADENRPGTHYHIVFQGRAAKDGHWALEPTELDDIIYAAANSAGIFGVDMSTAGNIQPVKTSVCAYLAKYMTKGGNVAAPWVGTKYEPLLPRQWWFWSRPLLLWVREHIIPINFGFLRWVFENRNPLIEKGLIKCRLLDLPDPRAPQTYEIDWLTCGNVAQLLFLWELDEWDDEWYRVATLRQAASYGLAVPQLDLLP